MDPRHKKFGYSFLPAIERFALSIKIDVNSGCWNCITHLDKDGYGKFRDCSMNKARQPIHRWAYKYFIDRYLADNLVSDHLCNNTRCANPRHLNPTTTIKNVMRGKGACAMNARKTHAKCGHPFDTVRSNTRTCKKCFNSYHAAYERKKRRQLKNTSLPPKKKLID